MWTWIFQIVLSIFILWTGHSLWNYFLYKFSKQKTRDLVNIHTEKYKSIINELTQKIETQNQTKLTEELQADLQSDLEQFVNQYSQQDPVIKNNINISSE